VEYYEVLSDFWLITLLLDFFITCETLLGPFHIGFKLLQEIERTVEVGNLGLYRGHRIGRAES
jgi:hypothetical protein